MVYFIDIVLLYILPGYSVCFDTAGHAKSALFRLAGRDSSKVCSRASPNSVTEMLLLVRSISPACLVVNPC